MGDVADARDREPVHVVLSADANYVMPLAATVRSITDNTPSAEVLVLANGLTAQDRERLAGSWRADARVRFLDVSDLRLPGTAPSAHITSTTYVRLFLAELVPTGWRRVVYVDVDTISEGDLTDLFALDLRSKPVGAVEDLWFTRWCRKNPLPCHGVLHFNAGVLLIDMDRWRAERLGQRALDQVYSLPVGLRSDQAALNVLLDGRWRPISRTWNVMTYMYYELPRLGEAHHAAVHDLRIRHFAGPKPWAAGGFPSATLRWVSPGLSPDLDARLYFKYLDRTRWAGWRPEASIGAQRSP